jgi:hypothetical protein
MGYYSLGDSNGSSSGSSSNSPRSSSRNTGSNRSSRNGNNKSSSCQYGEYADGSCKPKPNEFSGLGNTPNNNVNGKNSIYKQSQPNQSKVKEPTKPKKSSGPSQKDKDRIINDAKNNKSSYLKRQEEDESRKIATKRSDKYDADRAAEVEADKKERAEKELKIANAAKGKDNLSEHDETPASKEDTARKATLAKAKADKKLEEERKANRTIDEVYAERAAKANANKQIKNKDTSSKGIDEAKAKRRADMLASADRLKKHDETYKSMQNEKSAMYTTDPKKLAAQKKLSTEEFDKLKKLRAGQIAQSKKDASQREKVDVDAVKLSSNFYGDYTPENVRAAAQGAGAINGMRRQAGSMYDSDGGVIYDSEGKDISPADKLYRNDKGNYMVQKPEHVYQPDKSYYPVSSTPANASPEQIAAAREQDQFIIAERKRRQENLYSNRLPDGARVLNGGTWSSPIDNTNEQIIQKGSYDTGVSPDRLRSMAPNTVAYGPGGWLNKSNKTGPLNVEREATRFSNPDQKLSNRVNPNAMYDPSLFSSRDAEIRDTANKLKQGMTMDEINAQKQMPLHENQAFNSKYAGQGYKPTFGPITEAEINGIGSTQANTPYQNEKDQVVYAQNIMQPGETQPLPMNRQPIPKIGNNADLYFDAPSSSPFYDNQAQRLSQKVRKGRGNRVAQEFNRLYDNANTPFRSPQNMGQHIPTPVYNDSYIGPGRAVGMGANDLNNPMNPDSPYFNPSDLSNPRNPKSPLYIGQYTGEDDKVENLYDWD